MQDCFRASAKGSARARKSRLHARDGTPRVGLYYEYNYYYYYYYYYYYQYMNHYYYYYVTDITITVTIDAESGEPS